MKIDLNKRVLESLLVMAHLIEARDAYTGGHVWRVSEFSRLVSARLGLSPGETFVVGLGAMLHDVGKVGIPDAVLGKPGALTKDEYAIIQQHPAIGRELMERHPMAEMVLDIVTGHHERVDGRGYPDRMSGKAIPIYTRIVSVADAFDAMTSTRPYRQGMPMDQALSLLQAEKNSQFDGMIVEIFEGLGADGSLAHIVGNSDYDRPLGICPVHGETIVIPKTAVDGDIVYCNQCKGKFRLHISGKKFELEFTNSFQPDLKPIIEIDRIAEFVSEAPQEIAI